MPAAKLSLQPRGLSELHAQLVPARSLLGLGLQPGLAQSCGAMEGPWLPWEALPLTQPRPVPCSFWEVQVSARQVGSPHPLSLQQQLSSQHCPAPAT